MNTYEALARAQKAGDIVGTIQRLDDPARLDLVDAIVNKQATTETWTLLDATTNVRVPRKRGFISSETTRSQVRQLLIANGFKPRKRVVRLFRRG